MSPSAANPSGAAGASGDLAIGLGYDRHRLVPGRPMRLGGIELPDDRGPLGHSDGDALLHAAIDAVLGAAGQDDLGTLFPDSDPAHRGADSRTLAGVALRRVHAAGFEVLSMDCVVVADAPRIGPHRAALRAALATVFQVAPERVNVKGKSREGEGDADLIECTVVALLRSGR